MSKCGFCVNNEWITEDGHRFHWCKTHSDNYGSGYEERDCEEFKPITNGDRIRSMSDEELARLLCEKNKYCITCEGREFCVYDEEKANGLIKWMEQEVNDD